MRRWLPGLILIVGVSATLASPMVRAHLTALLAPLLPSAPAAAADAHDHAHEEADPDVIEPTPTARKGLGLKFLKVTRSDEQRTISIPAVLAERPGKSEVEVAAPLTGIVTKVHIVQGESVEPGQPLFDLRITHADLLDAQTEFLRSLEELDVANREVARLTKLTDQGTVPGQRLLQIQYEQEKLVASVKVERQALILHGLVADQVATIEKDRTLLPQLTVSVPNATGLAPRADGVPTLVAEYLHVTPGSFVQAGDKLCVLSDHAELYIEGKAFEQDVAPLTAALRAGTRLSATFERGDDAGERLDNLELLFVANRVDRQSRTVDFYLRLPNEPASTRRIGDSHRFVDWRYRPGRRLHVHLPVETWSQQIVLPASAVVDEGIDSQVFVRDGFKFRRVRVVVRDRNPERVVLADNSDLKPGDVVVTQGAIQLHLALKLQASGGADAGHHGHSH